MCQNGKFFPRQTGKTGIFLSSNAGVQHTMKRLVLMMEKIPGSDCATTNLYLIQITEQLSHRPMLKTQSVLISTVCL